MKCRVDPTLASQGGEFLYAQKWQAHDYRQSHQKAIQNNSNLSTTLRMNGLIYQPLPLLGWHQLKLIAD